MWRCRNTRQKQTKLTMSNFADLKTFDGLDNRKEVMILLHRLGSDEKRAAFLCSLVSQSQNGFAGTRPQVVNHCDPVTAYYMLVGVCNELGVSIDYAARKLEQEIKRALQRPNCATNRIYRAEVC